MQTLLSQIDKSVNFIEQQLVGFIESRYVRKIDEYFICYLSSQTGCNRGCTFCHLTATDQTSFEDVTMSEFLLQYQTVHAQYVKSGVPAKYVHFNFMARGEPLANKFLMYGGLPTGILAELGRLALMDGLTPKFNMSTIMPVTLKKSLVDIFPLITPTIYYSLYSVSESFRNKWLPAAMPVGEALRQLKEYQSFSKKLVKIHHAFIKGENDSLADVTAMCDAIEESGLLCEFNLVRYNPFSPEQGSESDADVLYRNILEIDRRFAGKVQVIPRIGIDVKASCGMFVESADV